MSKPPKLSPALEFEHEQGNLNSFPYQRLKYFFPSFSVPSLRLFRGKAVYVGMIEIQIPSEHSKRRGLSSAQIIFRWSTFEGIEKSSSRTKPQASLSREKLCFLFSFFARQFPQGTLIKKKPFARTCHFSVLRGKRRKSSSIWTALCCDGYK